MKLNDVSVGTRLGAGFCMVLVLLALVSVTGVWYLGTAKVALRTLMSTPLVKERLAEEWFRTVSVTVRRTTAIVKSKDPSLAAYFATEAKTSTKRAEEIIAAISALPANDSEKRIAAKLLETRKGYLVARDTALALKKQEQDDEAARYLADTFAPRAAAYLADMQAFLDFQRSSIDQAAGDAEADADRGRSSTAALGATALLVGAALATLLTRSITRPVARAARLADAVAAGDLSKSLVVEGRDEIAQLMKALQKMNGNLNVIVGDVRLASSSMETASSEVASGNLDLSARTEQTAAHLQQAAASIELLTTTVRHSADSASQADKMARSAGDVAARGGQVISEVVSTMDGISTASRKIGDIIGVIDGIAFQTNILALNAAVEAARAGEGGRGFAVVATEVRSLAGRSAAAAREIKGLIQASAERVERGTHLVGEAGKTMGDIVESVQRVCGVVADITRSAEGQRDGIDRINGSVAELDQMTQRNAALVEQSAAAAESLRHQATRLAGTVSAFVLADTAVTAFA